MNYGFTDFLQLFGSLGLFLFGMKVMSDALLNLAGDRMRKILATMTSNKYMGIFTGFLITSVIQSSSATTLMVVSFSNASLLTLTEAISVIMGANIGTTITAWLITILGFKVSMSAIALPLVGFGFAFTFSKKPSLKNWGAFIIGFSILFIGLQFLKDAVPDIKSNPEILAFLTSYTDLGFWSILIFLLIGTLLTVIIQSSSATMALTLIMTAQGWISFELAAAMVLGENIGTTITANLAAIVANFQAKRTARAHFLFNIIGVIWVLILFYPFLKLVTWVSLKTGSDSPYLTAAAIPVAISLFHTIFNICNTFLLMWFIKPIAKIVERLVPEKEIVEKEMDEPKFLMNSVLEFPETLIHSLKNESKYLFENSILEIVSKAMNIISTDLKSETKIKKVVKKNKQDLKTDVDNLYYTKVKNIYGKIIEYATKGQSSLKLTQNQTKEISEVKLANRVMVEIVKNCVGLNKNVTKYFNSENEFVKKEYYKYRKKIAKVIRVLYLFAEQDEKDKYYLKLSKLKQEAEQEYHHSNESINSLIRQNLISVSMASSLINDNDTVNDIIKKLITVAELLFTTKDSLLENGT
ncbi:Na/Pi cotransporter family protein [Aureisphaera sp. CAU 1614]|uniref:Na/Pi cotransporter family protein n=1 Tax=Halomarinibacterium sedimenti TaxID=2857106 RepID=A0A9X1FQA1_9FLAO|nr:Na/Pi cotransporter family protein [Halomarinibacterium sedimenti]MBW2938550.1 Na/Pi cotransporter family protein [Halomarinibacterium sedimenti]